MNGVGRFLLVFAVCFGLSACATVPLATAPLAERQQIKTRLMTDISVLASDEFEGRKPGTNGEALTVEYIIGRMQDAGLSSGTNDPGSAWKAPVPLVSSTPTDNSMSIRYDGEDIPLDADMAAAFTSAARLLVDSASMVFVGYEAENVDPDLIAGKVVVMLGEPGVSPSRRATLFKADPAAVVTVVSDGDGLVNVKRAYDRERVTLATEEEKRITAFVSQSAMGRVFGADHWSALKQQAAGQGFVPGPLGASATIEASSQRREFTSSNVIGVLPGAVAGTGAVLVLGHWDHLGVCASSDSEDPFCNGAVDNASGIAVMLELARRLKAAGPHDRDIYFLATTAEESGLYGARAFTQAPPVPLDTFVAAFNLDTVAVAPEGSAVGFVGEGRTELDEVILEVMEAGQRKLGNREFAESFVRRQDGWALLEAGVPTVFLSSSFGSEIVLGPFLSGEYHSPRDEIEGIELGGAIDDLLLHEEMVRRLASTQLYRPPGNANVDSLR